MYTFHIYGLPNYVDNYFTEIASARKYQTRLAALQKYYLPRLKTSLGQLSLKYIGPKIRYNIPENLKFFSPYSFAKQYKNVLLSWQNSCRFSFYMLVTFLNTVLTPLFSLLSFTSTVAHPISVHTGMLFTTVFVLLCFSCWFSLRSIRCYFLLTCETSSIKSSFVLALASGLAENLTQVVFRQPFVIEHVGTRSLYEPKIETSDVIYILINMKSICDLWCHCFSSCCIRAISWFD